MLMRRSARSHVEAPMRLTMPYSVATQLTWDRGSVTVVPGAIVGMIRDSSRPVFLLWNVDRKAMMLLPPQER